MGIINTNTTVKESGKKKKNQHRKKLPKTGEQTAPKMGNWRRKREQDRNNIYRNKSQGCSKINDRHEAKSPSSEKTEKNK